MRKITGGQGPPLPAHLPKDLRYSHDVNNSGVPLIDEALYSYLRVLASQGQPRPHNDVLCQRWQVHQSTLFQSFARIERRGWIRRLPKNVIEIVDNGHRTAPRSTRAYRPPKTEAVYQHLVNLAETGGSIGNLKAMARELGISYSSVRAALEVLQKRLDVRVIGRAGVQGFCYEIATTGKRTAPLGVTTTMGERKSNALYAAFAALAARVTYLEALLGVVDTGAKPPGRSTRDRKPPPPLPGVSEGLGKPPAAK